MFQFLFALFFIISLMNCEQLIPASQQAISLWIEKLLPSMFFMMVLLKLVVQWEILKPFLKPFCFIFQRCFGLDENSFALCLNLLLIGYPAGSIMVDQKVKEGIIDAKQGQRLLNCCSCASFGFIWLSVGKVFLNSLSLGIRCWLIQIVISFIFLWLTRKTVCFMNITSSNIQIIDDFKSAISGALNAMLQILGYVMMALCIGTLLLQLLPQPLADFLQPLLEFSNGCYLISQKDSLLVEKAMRMSMLIAFGGFCVHLQIIGMVENFRFDYGMYFRYRLLAVLLAGLLSIFMF